MYIFLTLKKQDFKTKFWKSGYFNICKFSFISRLSNSFIIPFTYLRQYLFMSWFYELRLNLSLVSPRRKIKLRWSKSSGVVLTNIIFPNECPKGNRATVLNVLKMVQTLSLHYKSVMSVFMRLHYAVKCQFECMRFSFVTSFDYNQLFWFLISKWIVWSICFTCERVELLW